MVGQCNQCGSELFAGEEDLIGEECECGGDFVEIETEDDSDDRLTPPLLTATLPL